MAQHNSASFNTNSFEYESSETDSMADTSDSELFTHYCPTCLLSFDEELEHRSHYKTDLHLYNVKRKLVGLQPASLEVFTRRKPKIALCFRNPEKCEFGKSKERLDSVGFL
jgi:hypothetical protein